MFTTGMGITCLTLSRLEEVGEEEAFEGKLRKTALILSGKKVVLAVGTNNKDGNYPSLNS